MAAAEGPVIDEAMTLQPLVLLCWSVSEGSCASRHRQCGERRAGDWGGRLASNPFPEATMADLTELPQGGSFLWEEAGSRKIMAPELFTDEQREFARTAREFTEKEIHPRLASIEAKALES